MSLLTIKSSFNGDIRRITFPSDIDLSTLSAVKSSIHRVYSLSPSTSISIKYEDDEGDYVTAAEQYEWGDAVQMAKENKQKSIQIAVFTRDSTGTDSTRSVSGESSANATNEDTVNAPNATAAVTTSISTNAPNDELSRDHSHHHPRGRGCNGNGHRRHHRVHSRSHERALSLHHGHKHVHHGHDHHHRKHHFRLGIESDGEGQKREHEHRVKRAHFVHHFHHRVPAHTVNSNKAVGNSNAASSDAMRVHRGQHHIRRKLKLFRMIHHMRQLMNSPSTASANTATVGVRAHGGCRSRSMSPFGFHARMGQFAPAHHTTSATASIDSGAHARCGNSRRRGCAIKQFNPFHSQQQYQRRYQPHFSYVAHPHPFKHYQQ